MQSECFLCHKYGTLEKHHIFGGANRKKSEKLGLYVFICPSCHRDNKNGVHGNSVIMETLHEYGQIKAMKEQNWDKEQFVKEFGKNYL